MIVPEYWSEATTTITGEAGSRTLRRFGWSDQSETAAAEHAESRLAKAAARFNAGDEIDVREPKVPYNGADGLPIREQIIARHGDMVLTRNAYGSVCLNTPDVAFADVDVVDPIGCKVYVMTFLVSIIAWTYLAIQLGMDQPWFAILMLAILSGGVLGSLLHQVMRWWQGTPEQHARRRITRFADSHPDWSFRLYRTPAGFRILVTHATLEPRGDVARRFFDGVSVDPVYARMCFNQNCFRARVTPKPWRIGIDDHLKPRPGVWPIDPTRLPDRQAWVDTYDRKRVGYAACRFESTLGKGHVCEAVANVMRVHDDWSGATGRHPIA
ncbi:MAG: hypothetical protein AAF539_11635 [Planctomycetota bacterium]